MYTVGLDKCKSFLILFSQNVSTRRENNSNKVLSDSEGVNSDRTPENIDQAKEILFGSLLGDGKLEMPPRGINARFGFTQSEAQKDYFLLVYNLLLCICSAKYREYSYADKRTGKTYKSLNF